MTFLHWLTLLFIGLKLTGHIQWSWWFVLMPAIAGMIIYVARSEDPPK